MEKLKETKKLSEFELTRLANLKDNKLVLSRLLADLKNAPPIPSKPIIRKERKTKKEQVNRRPLRDRNVVQRSPPRTRGSKKDVELDLEDESDDENKDNKVKVKFSFFGRFSGGKKACNEGEEDNSSQNPIGTSNRKRLMVIDERSADEITEDDLLRVVDAFGEKKYDSVMGTSCHQCRQKTEDQKTICRSGQCIGVRGQFCGPCLRIRYGEDVRTSLKDPSWNCPPCRGICNCSFCRKKAGYGCTGILIHLAQARGFSDVNSYLMSLQKRIISKNGSDTEDIENEAAADDAEQSEEDKDDKNDDQSDEDEKSDNVKETAECLENCNLNENKDSHDKTNEENDIANLEAELVKKKSNDKSDDILPRRLRPKREIKANPKYEDDEPLKKKKPKRKKEEEILYCICKSPDEDGFMIACDKCDKWYHGDCINITKRKAKSMDVFYCDYCE